MRMKYESFANQDSKSCSFCQRRTAIVVGCRQCRVTQLRIRELEKWKAARYTPFYTPVGCSAEQEDIYDTELFETAVRSALVRLVKMRWASHYRRPATGHSGRLRQWRARVCRTCRTDSRMKTTPVLPMQRSKDRLRTSRAVAGNGRGEGQRVKVALNLNKSEIEAMISSFHQTIEMRIET